MKFLKNSIVFLAFLMPPALPAAASVTVYVSTSGVADATHYVTDGTSDQVEINQALLDVFNGDGGTVHLSSGVYTVDDTIVIYDSTTLQGDGWDAIVKLKDAAGWAQYKGMVENQYKNSGGAAYNCNITLRNFKIDGNRDNQSEAQGTYYYTAVDMKYVRNVMISGMNIGNNLNDSVKMTTASSITVQNCTMEESGHASVYCSNVSTAVIRDNDLGVQTNSGVRTYNANHITITGNRIYGTGTGDWGVQIQQYGTGIVDDILVEKNRIYDTGHGGIGLFADAITVSTRACNVRIMNNLIYHNNDYNSIGQGNGIAINNFNNTVIENNTIFNNRKSGIAFNDFYSAVSWHLTATVKNNIIANNGTYGLNASGYNASFVSSCNDLWQNQSADYAGDVSSAYDIAVDPLFAAAPTRSSWSVGPTCLTVDLHIKSKAGRLSGTSWVTDTVNSPCLDAGDQSYPYSNEPTPNGDRINLGGYGDTVEASMSNGRGSVAGRVTGYGSGVAIQGATVTVSGYSTLTDSDGNYSITGILSDVYVFSVVASGYVPCQRSGITVTKDNVTHEDYQLAAAAAPPTVPQNLAAVAGDKQVTLSWDIPESDGGSPVTGYRVYRNSVLAVQAGPALSYTDTALANGTQYAYRISAVNASGESPQCPEILATPAGGKPYAYPVPFIGGKSRVITFSNVAAPAQLRIYAVSGTLVFDQEVNAASFDFVPEDIASGVYLYVIKSARGTSSGKVVIIK